MIQKLIIKRIHNEFDTAQERLLTEANAIIANAQNNAILSIGDRLKSVGFVNTAVAKQADTLRRSLVTSTEQAELIRYYNQKYPFLKFLTETELQRICDKYNLIFAPVGNYIKDVPEKNLRDIETAQTLDANDVVHIKHVLDIKRFSYGVTVEFADFCRSIELTVDFPNPDLNQDSIRSLAYNAGFTGNTHVSYAPDWSKSNYVQESEIHTIDRTGLFIAAPPSHFDLTGLQKKGKHGFFNVSVLKIEVKDPIVFRYVRGGIQVITKWGLEGNDPALVLPVMN